MAHPVSTAKPWTEEERQRIKLCRQAKLKWEDCLQFFEGRTARSLRTEWEKMQGGYQSDATYDARSSDPLPAADMRPVFAPQCQKLHDAIERYQARIRAEIAALTAEAA